MGWKLISSNNSSKGNRDRNTIVGPKSIVVVIMTVVIRLRIVIALVLVMLMPSNSNRKSFGITDGKTDENTDANNHPKQNRSNIQISPAFSRIFMKPI